MIIVNLKGGTGNQLFQYALARHLALKNNDTLKLDIDGLARANITGDIYRPFALKAFNIVEEVASPDEVQQLKYPYGIISKAWRWFRFKILRKTNIFFDAQVLTWIGDIYLDGYWQSPLYFEEIRNILLQELTLAEPLSQAAAMYAKQIKDSHSVSLHVRRGDYINNPRVQKEFGLCTGDYYEKAIAHITAHVTNPTYFVFSDDIKWVRNNLLLGEQVVYVKDQNLTDTEELFLMSLCKHNIIANSSFSWWGAWLNQNNAKIVIAPTPWFNEQPCDKNLIPDSWIQLPK